MKTIFKIIMFLVYSSGVITIWSVGLELTSIFIEYKNIQHYHSYLFYLGTGALLWYPINFLNKEYNKLVSDYNKEPKIKTKSEIKNMLIKAYIKGLRDETTTCPDFEDYFIENKDQAVNTDGSIKY